MGRNKLCAAATHRRARQCIRSRMTMLTLHLGSWTDKLRCARHFRLGLKSGLVADVERSRFSVQRKPMHRSKFIVYSITESDIPTATAMACSELFVESVLDEVIQHPVGLKRRRRIKLGNALHHSFFFGKGVQPTTKIEHLPVGAGAVHLSL
jgi:hypothetical protein